MNVLRGRVHKFGSDIDTDLIIGSKYLQLADPCELGRHCLEAVAPEFSGNARGGILMALENFGIGSSREQAVMAIAACGVSCVIASSFARLFFRNAINTGLVVIECREIVDVTSSGEIVEVDVSRGVVTNVTRAQACRVNPYPAFIRQIVEAGGLIPFARPRLLEGRTRVFDGLS
jgi:3-isopropylmalate dehydratase small subunit